MRLLTPQQVEAELKKLAVEWSVIGGSQLERHYDFDDYSKGAKFVATIAKIAEKYNHHPEIRLSYDSVNVTIATHSLGGLTHKDFELANKIESSLAV